MLYRLFGHTVTSDFPFVNRMTPGDGDPDLIISCVDQPPPTLNWEETSPVYPSHVLTEGGDPTVCLYHLAKCDVLSFPRIADFYIWPDHIICHRSDPRCRNEIEIYLLGTVLSLWLEKRGIPALHAAAVAVDGGAIAFLSSNGGGKSSLAAAFMQVGYALLADDILPVAQQDNVFSACPGYPQMRFWPNEAMYFIGHYEDLELVHPSFSKRRIPIGPENFGAFCSAPLPLACLYLPERLDTESGCSDIKISQVSPRDATIELIRHSFDAMVLDALGLHGQRLDLLARMARRVPLRRITYPSGFQHLPAARNAILDDLQMLRRQQTKRKCEFPNICPKQASQIID